MTNSGHSAAKLHCFANGIPPTPCSLWLFFFPLRESSSFEDLEERLKKLKVQLGLQPDLESERGDTAVPESPGQQKQNGPHTGPEQRKTLDEHFLIKFNTEYNVMLRSAVELSSGVVQR